MVLLNKTWSDDLNNLLPNTDQVVQYRELFYNLKQTFLAANWVLEFTCDGTTANSSDNLPNAAAVTIGTEGSENISYFVVASPVNWVTGGQIRICIFTNNANADTTPTVVGMIKGNQAFVLDASPLQNRPTCPVEVDMSGVNNWGTNFVPWASPLTGYWNSWTTTDGTVIFGVKVSGEGLFRNVAIIAAEQGSNGFGDWRHFVYLGGSATSSNQIQWNELTTGVNFRGFGEDGSTSIQPELACTAASMDQWQGGADGSGRVPRISVDVVVNNVNDPRFMGQLSDIYGAPNNAPFNEVEDADLDPVRLNCLGALWWPCTASDLPLS